MGRKKAAKLSGVGISREDHVRELARAYWEAMRRQALMRGFTVSDFSTMVGDDENWLLKEAFASLESPPDDPGACLDAMACTAVERMEKQLLAAGMTGYEAARWSAAEKQAAGVIDLWESGFDPARVDAYLRNRPINSYIGLMRFLLHLSYCPRAREVTNAAIKNAFSAAGQKGVRPRLGALDEMKEYVTGLMRDYAQAQSSKPSRAAAARHVIENRWQDVATKGETVGYKLKKSNAHRTLPEWADAMPDADTLFAPKPLQSRGKA